MYQQPQYGQPPQQGYGQPQYQQPPQQQQQGGDRRTYPYQGHIEWIGTEFNQWTSKHNGRTFSSTKIRTSDGGLYTINLQMNDPQILAWQQQKLLTLAQTKEVFMYDVNTSGKIHKIYIEWSQFQDYPKNQQGPPQQPQQQYGAQPPQPQQNQQPPQHGQAPPPQQPQQPVQPPSGNPRDWYWETFKPDLDTRRFEHDRSTFAHRNWWIIRQSTLATYLERVSALIPAGAEQKQILEWWTWAEKIANERAKEIYLSQPPSTSPPQSYQPQGPQGPPQLEDDDIPF